MRFIYNLTRGIFKYGQLFIRDSSFFPPIQDPPARRDETPVKYVKSIHCLMLNAVTNSDRLTPAEPEIYRVHGKHILVIRR